jgi:hypothetical protein
MTAENIKRVQEIRQELAERTAIENEIEIEE